MKDWLRGAVYSALRTMQRALSWWKPDAGDHFAFFPLAWLGALGLLEHLQQHPEELESKGTLRAIPAVLGEELAKLECFDEARIFDALTGRETLDGPELACALDTMVDEPASLPASRLIVEFRNVVARRWPFTEEREPVEELAVRLGLLKKVPAREPERSPFEEPDIHFAFLGERTTACGEPLPKEAEAEFASSPRPGQTNLVWTTRLLDDSGKVRIDCTRCRRELKERGEEVLRRVREQSAAMAQAAREKAAKSEAGQEQELAEPQSQRVAVEGSGT